VEALASHRIDFALLRPPVRREFESVRVVREPLLAALPIVHRLAEGRPPKLGDFDRDRGREAGRIRPATKSSSPRR
jgi:DNA-binding transcriptional LysR family regulator